MKFRNLLFLALLATVALAVPLTASAVTYDFDNLIGCVDDANLNSDESDVTISVPNGGRYYFVTRMLAYNASTSLSGSSAEIGLFSAAAGAGEEIVTPTTMTGLTAAAKLKSFTIAQDDLITASTLYVHTDDAHGSAATVDVCIYGVVVDSL
jgi:hypothetical protein